MAGSSSPLTVYTGPGCLAGVTLRNWLTLLWQNHFRVSPRYLGKAMYISGSSVLTSAVAVIEQLAKGRTIDRQSVEQPVFVLGCWRSGTTYLHTMLCLDQMYAGPTLFQTMYPHTYLMAEPWLKPLLRILTPGRRFMDNMPMGLDEPHEDEMALSILSQKSNMLSWAFPHHAADYDRYLDFEQASDADQKRWKTALGWYLRKLTYTYNKQLVLKSPNHTARIKLILDVFPDAKFVHIHRHPFEVYRSMCHMASRVMPVWGLQHTDPNCISDIVIDTYQRLYTAYFNQVELIPKDRFCEVSFKDATARPLETMATIYDQLQLGDFGRTQSAVENYVAGLKNYQPNRHADVADDIKERLTTKWHRSFEQWGYTADC